MVAEQLPIDRCDVVKLDIEGGELDALVGGRKLLAEHRPLVCLELNPHRMAQFGWSVAELAAFSAELGYGVWHGLGRGARRVEREPETIVNVFLVPEDRSREYGQAARSRQPNDGASTRASST